MNPKEVLNLSIGQAGVQISNATWELLCIEHGFEANGRPVNEDSLTEDPSYKTFFQCTPSGQYVPRHVLIDLEPTVIDEIMCGPYRQLYHPDRMIKGDEDAGNNFARGHFTKGKSILRRVEDSIRKVIESCDSFQGFFVNHSYSGGSGSGFTSLLLEKLSFHYAKRTRFSMAIFPSPLMSTAVVEPYNSVLHSHAAMECTDVAVIMDNESLYDICSRYLDCQNPTYIVINRLIGQVVSAMTSSLRYESYVNNDLDSMMTNLIPYPRLHFPIINYAPILSLDRANHSSMSVSEITRELFEPTSQTLKVNISEGRYMSCSIQFRGEVSPRQVQSAIVEIKSKEHIQFVDWCPTGFKIGLNSVLPTSVPSSNMAPLRRNATMVTNNTALVTVLQTMIRKFTMLFSKRAMVHHYVGEGMEEGEFTEAKEDYNQLVQDYLEAALPTTAGDDGDGDGGGLGMDSGKMSPQASGYKVSDYERSPSPAGSIHGSPSAKYSSKPVSGYGGTGSTYSKKGGSVVGNEYEGEAAAAPEEDNFNDVGGNADDEYNPADMDDDL